MAAMHRLRRGPTSVASAALLLLATTPHSGTAVSSCTSPAGAWDASCIEPADDNPDNLGAWDGWDGASTVLLQRALRLTRVATPPPPSGNSVAVEPAAHAVAGAALAVPAAPALAPAPAVERVGAEVRTARQPPGNLALASSADLDGKAVSSSAGERLASPGSNNLTASELHQKDKVLLLVLEMIPLCGPLGIDRYYLGQHWLALGKFLVCVCTWFAGGLIWGAVDAIAIIANALERKDSIESLGMVANFEQSSIEPARKLGMVAAAVWALFILAGGGCLRALGRRLAKGA